ncbi:PREDICTED: uncharacterized protein LOC105951830 [Erythranthe guttata]|uniref:uncharacterized protein LOC105951830 n=1 Tax=Erythranthe guttata TaxID=4155 RepID=UPI00064E0EFF|nr:PREDICTED: uncharacterized protein LOC105951830 [Erythranthe guttata]|eukprot:XP_012830744.1 PREDICTED: uncharacterized protein LOC105951830 [Erythranthe guttata]
MRDMDADRVRNYLEDQFLGFTSVPLSDIVSDESGNSPREFDLSSSEIMHSHAGFVELSFNYSGIISHESHSVSVADVAHEQNVSCDLDRIEFPDQETVNENERTVSEHLRFPCDELDPQVQGGSCPLENDDNDLSLKGGGSCPLRNGDNNLSSKGGYFPLENDDNSLRSEGGSCPLSCIEVSSLETGDAEKRDDHKGGGGDGGEGVSGILPLVVSDETKETVVQEEIVDMYMKGMQQFTDALAKMKLPMDTGDGSKVETDDAKMENNQAGPNGKIQGSKSPDLSSPRVFYGSGAFF